MNVRPVVKSELAAIFASTRLPEPLATAVKAIADAGLDEDAACIEVTNAIQTYLNNYFADVLQAAWLQAIQSIPNAPNLPEKADVDAAIIKIEAKVGAEFPWDNKGLRLIFIEDAE